MLDTYNSNHELLNIFLGYFSVKSIFYLVEIENEKITKFFKKIKSLYPFFLAIILASWISYSAQSSITIFIDIYSGTFLAIIEKSLTKKSYYLTVGILSIFLGGFYSLFGSSIKEKIIGILILVAILVIFEIQVNIKNIINHLSSLLIFISLSRIDSKYSLYLENKIRKTEQYSQPLKNSFLKN